MALWSALVSIGADSALPKHRVVNTLHFNGVGTFLSPESDVSAIATDLANAYAATIVGSLREVNVKVYNLDDPKPRPIRAQATVNPGSYPASTCPREVAMCLSFYSERNLPRNRGRIYLPAFILGGTVGVKPTNTQMDVGIALYNRLKDIGAVDLEWSVFSRRDNQHKQISNGWVDDEWDTVRSRGLQAATRRTVTAEG